MLLAQETTSDGTMFLGDDLLPWLLIAFGAAMAVGTAMALVRPRPDDGDDDEAGGDTLVRPPLGRSVVMIAIGTLAAVWGLASLLT